PTMVETTFRLIGDVRRQGVTVLMVEQNAALALRMADRGYVMETGRTVLEGPARELLTNEHVRRAYMAGRTRAKPDQRTSGTKAHYIRSDWGRSLTVGSGIAALTMCIR